MLYQPRNDPPLRFMKINKRESLFLSHIPYDFLFPHRAADEFEFEEPAFEGAVEERRATTGGQPDQLGQTKICRKEVRPPACEVLLQAVADPRVERGQLCLPKANSIRGVRDQYSLLGRWLDVEHVGLLECHSITQASGLEIDPRRLERGPVDVAPVKGTGCQRPVLRPSCLA